MNKLHPLNLPQVDLKIANHQGQLHVFDAFRKKYVVLTPEEWVRQNFAHFLVRNLHYPAGLIQFEKELKYDQLKKRADILVHDKMGAPLLMVECKAPKIPINQKTFDQIAAYNHVLQLSYIIVTNGMKHYCVKVDHQKGDYQFLKEIPEYQSL